MAAVEVRLAHDYITKMLVEAAVILASLEVGGQPFRVGHAIDGAQERSTPYPLPCCAGAVAMMAK